MRRDGMRERYVGSPGLTSSGDVVVDPGRREDFRKKYVFFWLASCKPEGESLVGGGGKGVCREEEMISGGD